ncbi:MAG: discoidin domain-containing protein [Tannerellaceae bacterium]|nr:discoidin domain-containing protein [Tannerellaceae bacterium]
MKKQGSIFLLFVCMLVACMQEPPLERALKAAGENRGELQQVLNRYSRRPEDSLKLKAAVFLIENMPYYSYYESEKLDFLKNNIYPTVKEKKIYIAEAISLLKEQLGIHLVLDLQKKKDIETISADYLINNIEYAFKAWEKAPWKQHISFDLFCREILPYRVADETPDDWRELYFNTFSPVLDSLGVGADPVAACQALYDYLVREEWIFTVELNLPHVGAFTLFNYRLGGCLEYCDFVLYVMRSVGIPCGIDLIVQNPDKMYAAHYWNYMTDTLGHPIDFTLYEHRPDREVRDSSRKKGKVYRSCFDIQPGSLPVLYPNQEIPPALRSPFLKDVSREYYDGYELHVEVPEGRGTDKLFYLSVFNNHSLVPVAWTVVEKNKAVFKDLEGEIVYFPARFYGGKTVQAGYPVVIREGQVVTLQPDTTRKRVLHLHRKHPTPNWWEAYAIRSVNGRFQGANDPDFLHPEDLYVIGEEAEMKYYLVDVNSTNRYRYVRYLSAEEGYCNMAEIRFLADGEVLRGEVMGTEGSYKNSAERTKYAVFDNDPLTFYDAIEASGAWVGLDLGEPKRIDRIRYLFRNDDNGIRNGDHYELFFFDENGRRSLGMQTGTEAGVLVYDNVPSNALLLLRNHSRGREERIFTYENEQQVWW